MLYDLFQIGSGAREYMNKNLKICQIKMLKSCRIENDPFIGLCKVYKCETLNICQPCLFDVTPEDIVKDMCSRCSIGKEREWRE